MKNPYDDARSYLIDAGFIALYYSGNERAKFYFNRIVSGKAKGIISEVNLAEFYYKTGQQKGIDTAEVWYRQIRQGRFLIVSTDEEITRLAGKWKVRRNDLSLADCFALATLTRRADVLLTTDSILASADGLRSVHVSPNE